jgi:hypothetical protein
MKKITNQGEGLLVGTIKKTLYRFQEENLQWLANHFLGHYE